MPNDFVFPDLNFDVDINDNKSDKSLDNILTWHKTPSLLPSHAIETQSQNVSERLEELNDFGMIPEFQP